MEVHRVLSGSVAIALATFLVIGTSQANTLLPDVPIRQQIADIDRTIEMMEKMREAQEIINKIKELSDPENPQRDLVGDDLQAFLQSVKDKVRTTDLLAAGLEGEYGDDVSGVGFLMRQLYGVAKYFQDYQEILGVKNHVGPGAPDTFMGKYAEGTDKVFEALSGVDAALTLILSAVNADELTGGEALANLGNMLSSLEDAMGLLGVAVNPVLTAMISLYATALVNAGWVADNIIAPETARKNNAIGLWDRVMTGTPEGQIETGGVDPGEARLDAINDMLYELRHSRDQLAAGNDTDYSAARQTCIRNINSEIAAGDGTAQAMDVDGNGTFDDSDALRLVDDTLRDLAQIERETRELERLRDLRGFREADVRRAQNNVDTWQEMLDGYKAADDRSDRASSTDTERAQGQLNRAEDALTNAQQALDQMPDDISELTDSIKEAYDRYEANQPLATKYKDCIRELLENYAPETLGDLDDSYVPEWIKNCETFNLSDNAADILVALDTRTSMMPGDAFGLGSGMMTDASTSVYAGLGAFQVATDSSQWCTYSDGQGQNMTPVGPGGSPAVIGGTPTSGGGGQPGQTPEGTPTDGTPTDDSGGGSPPDTTDDDGQSGGSPTDTGGGGRPPGSGMGIPTVSFPGSDTTDDDTTGDDTTAEPTASETPDDTTTADEPTGDDGQQPPETPGTIRITFKVTNQVLLANGQVTQQPGGENRRVKLFSPDTQNPDLPVAGNQRNDAGASEDPMQCTTNTLGECSVNASVDPSLVSTPFSGGSGQSDSGTGGTPEIEVDIPVNEVSAANVTLDDGAELPADLAQYVVGNWSIGNQATYSLAFQGGEDFQSMLSGLMAGGWQIDLCRDEQPAPPIGSLPYNYAEPDSELPRSSINLGFTTEVQHAN